MNPFGKYQGLVSLTMLLLLAPVVVWQYAVGDTVKKWRSTLEIRREISRLQNTQDHKASNDPTLISNEEMILSGLVIGGLLPIIEAEGLQIEHFSPVVTSETDGLRIATGRLSIGGGFKGMVKLLAGLENDLAQCKIISVHYRTAKPRNRNGTRTLGCTIYIQQITTAD